MNETTTQKQTTGQRKKQNRSNFNHKNRPVQRNHYQQKKEKFDPNRFHWCYGMGDIPEGMELVASSKKRITCEGTTNEQAKGQLRSDIRSLGGNATMGLNIERGGTVRCMFVAGYYPATITASAYSALILPKQIAKEEKEERENRFLTLNGLIPSPPQEEVKEEATSLKESMPLSLVIITCGIVLAFVACCVLTG